MIRATLACQPAVPRDRERPRHRAPRREHVAEDGIRRRGEVPLPAHEQQREARRQHTHERQVRGPHALAQEPRRQRHYEQRVCRLEEYGIGGRRQLVGEHEQQARGRVGQADEPHAPAPPAARFGDQRDDREHRHERAHRRDLPRAETAPFDGHPRRGEAYGGEHELHAGLQGRLARSQSRAMVAISRCSTSARALSRRISASEMRPASWASAAATPEYRVIAACRITGAASYGGK